MSKKCICTKVCDCQNPPPDDWNGKNGVFRVSTECPGHNERPHPHPDCLAYHPSLPLVRAYGLKGVI